MATERILFPDFRDENEASRYPFADSALLTTDTGLAIPNDTLLDAILYPIGSRERVYISQISIQPREVIITIGDAANSNLCSATFDPLDPPEIVHLEDSYGRPAGVFVSEALRLSIFASWPTGIHTFDLGDTEFVATVVIPTPEIGVRGLLTDKNELLTGDVWLIGDRGVVVREDGDGIIRVDIVGDPLFRRRLCLPEDLFTPPRYVRTINDCLPDAFGNVQLVVGNHNASATIIRIFADGEGLKIEAIGQVTLTG